MRPLPPVLTTQVFGWPIVAEPLKVWWPKLVEQVTTVSAQARPITIFTPNPEIVMTAQRDAGFHHLVTQADYLIPDGVGLVWATRLLRLRIKLLGPLIAERITGADLVTQLLDLAVEQQWRVLIVGGRNYRPGTVPSNQPAQHLAEFTGEVWWLPGYEHIAQPTGTEDENVLAEIERLKPAIVLVAFGAPHQERWVIEHQAELQKAGVRLVMTVGGALDYLLGKVQRAPRFMQVLGFEWLYRLVRQPWRGPRQVNLLKFIGLTLFG